MKDRTGKLLSIGVTVLGLAGTLLSSIVDSNQKKEMKEEIVKEVMNELSEQK